MTSRPQEEMKGLVIVRSRKRRSNLFPCKDCFAPLVMTPPLSSSNPEVILSTILSVSRQEPCRSKEGHKISITPVFAFLRFSVPHMPHVPWSFSGNCPTEGGPKGGRTMKDV
jgi:hypothetical protein